MSEKLFKVYWHPEAKKELRKLSSRKRKIVDEAVQTFEEKGTSFEKFGRLTLEEQDFDKFRIKLKQEKPVPINQRAILQEFYGNWVVLGIEHRDSSYEKPYIRDLIEREYSI